MNFSLGRISIVDDDESVRSATRALLRSFGYQVEMFSSANLFLEANAILGTDCLVLDVAMPGMDGFELQRRLNHQQSVVPIIFVTAHDNNSQRAKAMNAGAANFFHKPFEATELVAAIQAAMSSTPNVVSPQPGAPPTPGRWMPLESQARTRMPDQNNMAAIPK